MVRVLLGLLAAIPSAGLDDAAVARLREQKVLATDESFLSVSSPYKSEKHPYFITSDSVVAAYQSLLKESVGRLEWGKIAALPAALEALRAKLPEAVAAIDLDEDLTARAEWRARVILSTALLLLAVEPAGEDPAILAVARAEARRITEAVEVGKGWWYGPPEPDFRRIDYSRFRATDIDAAIPEIARGQRAIRWLSFLPLRIERAEEFLTALLLRLAADRAPDAAPALSGYPELLGWGDELSLLDPRLEVPARVDRAAFAVLRRRALELSPMDPVRDRAVDPEHRLLPTIRVLPVAAPDCGRLLQAASDLRFAAKESPIPTALTVAAALGSPIARDALGPRDRAAVEALGSLAAGPTHYDRFLRCLRLLHAPPDERAPAFMAGRAWRLKSLQTTLAGWTLLRHAWSTRVKCTLVAFGCPNAPGFVEPAPAFFAALADVAEATGKRVEALGADGQCYAHLEAAVVLEALANVLTEIGWEPFAGDYREDALPRLSKRAAEDAVLSRRWDIILYRLDSMLRGYVRDAVTLDEKEFARRIAGLRKKAREVREAGRIPTGVGWDIFWHRDDPVAPRWNLLAETLRELAVVAEQQLAGHPFSVEQEKWIRRYGERLAEVLGEPSTGSPSDDAFAAVAVHADPATGRWLVEAVGRPRALYVLYPTADGEVLCRGAVLPWHELVTPSPLTDSEWRRRLDADPPPRPHEILADLYSE